MSSSSNKGVALITGASTGIGAVYADRLARRGYDLILVARNEARLMSLSGRLTSDTGRSVTVLPADLSNKVELAKVELTLRDDSSIAMLVNNVPSPKPSQPTRGRSRELRATRKRDATADSGSNAPGP